jgi:hypothetical protein
LEKQKTQKKTAKFLLRSYENDPVKQKKYRAEADRWLKNKQLSFMEEVGRRSDRYDDAGRIDRDRSGGGYGGGGA